MSAKEDLCAICRTKAGIFKCKGCDHVYCRHDLNIHRNDLDSQLQIIIIELNTFQQTSKEKHSTLKFSLLHEINKWEMISIEKIQKTAEETRQQVEEMIASDDIQQEIKIEKINEQIRNDQHNDGFDEPLSELEENIFQTNIKIDQNKQDLPLVNNIYVNLQDIFNQKYGDVCIGENGHLACHNFNIVPSSGEIRGKRKYSIGTYRIRLKIEQLDVNPWWFFGIISKSTRMQSNSYTSLSAYGWAGHNEVYMYGSCKKNVNGYESDYATGDIIELILECDHRRIRMHNFRSKKSYEIAIDLEHCPFPWMIHLNLFHIQTRIKI
ncbi:hypothetical protein I4U23_031436 [Adineta vaga]|nr:hypothetical protein I4U23_031436 [Adineta vaga]